MGATVRRCPVERTEAMPFAVDLRLNGVLRSSPKRSSPKSVLEVATRTVSFLLASSLLLPKEGWGDWLRGRLRESAGTHNAAQVQNCPIVRCQGTLSGPSYPR